MTHAMHDSTPSILDHLPWRRLSSGTRDPSHDTGSPTTIAVEGVGEVSRSLVSFISRLTS